MHLPDEQVNIRVPSRGGTLRALPELGGWPSRELDERYSRATRERIRETLFPDLVVYDRDGKTVRYQLINALLSSFSS